MSRLCFLFCLLLSLFVSVQSRWTRCPQGERFFDGCNWCTCHPATGGTMCTLMACAMEPVWVDDE